MAKLIRKSFAVIGLGRFGAALAKTLYASGADVLAIDCEREKVNDIEPFCTQAVCADAANERVLSKLGVNSFDMVVICIGGDVEASVYVTLACKQLNVKTITAKAQNVRHREILEKIGADRVYIPEEHMGEKIAEQLLRPNMIEILSFSEGFKIVEIVTPQIWQNKSLIELDLRNKEKISIILIKRGEEIIAAPGGDCLLLADDTLVISGAGADIRKLSSKATKEVQV
ncbi:MAG: TrkA family potassium uptake protein [Firmicutes bacterium]|nr:TrkA family potassium uptake protein [Bacillota bacterium]